MGIIKSIIGKSGDKIPQNTQRKSVITKYNNFVRVGIGLPAIWGHLSQQIFLGGEKFINKHQKLIEQKESLDDIPALQKRAAPRPTSYYQNRYKDEKQAIYQIYRSGGYTLKDIGDHYGKHYTTISRIVRRMEL